MIPDWDDPQEFPAVLNHDAGHVSGRQKCHRLLHEWQERSTHEAEPTVLGWRGRYRWTRFLRDGGERAGQSAGRPSHGPADLGRDGDRHEHGETRSASWGGHPVGKPTARFGGDTARNVPADVRGSAVACDTLPRAIDRIVPPRTPGACNRARAYGFLLTTQYVVGKWQRIVVKPRT